MYVYTFILKDCLKGKNKPKIFLSVPTTYTHIFQRRQRVLDIILWSKVSVIPFSSLRDAHCGKSFSLATSGAGLDDGKGVEHRSIACNWAEIQHSCSRRDFGSQLPNFWQFFLSCSVQKSVRKVLDRIILICMLQNFVCHRHKILALLSWKERLFYFFSIPALTCRSEIKHLPLGDQDLILQFSIAKFLHLFYYSRNSHY